VKGHASTRLGGLRRVLINGRGELTKDLGEARHHLRVAQGVIFHGIGTALDSQGLELHRGKLDGLGRSTTPNEASGELQKDEGRVCPESTRLGANPDEKLIMFSKPRCPS
jgi:hypothetical protein